MAGGAGILFSGLVWIDPVLSLVIAAMIVWSSWSIVRETLNILLEGTPRAMKLGAVQGAIAQLPGVLDTPGRPDRLVPTQQPAAAAL